MPFDIDFKKQIIDKHSDLWTRKAYKRGDVLLTIGSIPTQNFYIETGMARSYIYEDDVQKEFTLAFISEDKFIPLYRDFTKELEFPFTVEVIEDSVIWGINRKNYGELVQREPALMLRLVAEWAVEIQMEIITHAKNLALYDLKTHYEKFLVTKSYAHRIADTYFASYFGVDKSTFNRKKNE